MHSLQTFAETKLEALDARSLRRRMSPTHRFDGLWVERGGRRLLSFSCNDYLGLSHHPDVKAAACRAIESYGVGAGASRLVTGDVPLLGELERRLAALKGTESACVFGSGYLANAGIIPTLVGREDLIVIDELAHSCLFAGSKLSGASVAVFPHNDVAALATLLAAGRKDHPRVLVATDGVFSMDGDVAPLDRLSAICTAHDAWLMTDDAHGIGVLAGGHGSAGLFPGVAVPLQMGTLSKAVGGYGGYLCASQAVIEWVRNRARTLVYSTGLPPASAAAAIAAVSIIQSDLALCALPLAKARRFTARVGLPLAQSPIVAVLIGEAGDALAASRALEAQGFLAVAIRPPTVPPGTARLRLTFTARHDEADIDRLADAVRPFVNG
jgi:8-amino-7-oxononanoate synthase